MWNKNYCFITVEVALTRDVIILLVKPVDISKRSPIYSVRMPWRSFININNSSFLTQRLRPGSIFLGVALNILII